MKKLGFVVVAIAVASFIAGAMYLDSPAIDVSLLRYEPFPAEPGRVVDVWLKAENQGKAANATVEIVGQYPYEVVKGKWETGILPTGEYMILHGRIRLNENAPDGTAKLRVRYSVEGVSVEKELDFDVESNPEFAASAENGTVEYGKVSPINVEIMALRNRASDVSVSISSADFRILGRSSFYLGEMEKGEKREIVINAYPVSDGKIGVINMTISYEYGNGVKGTKYESIGVLISKEPEILAVAEENKGRMRIKVVNAGYGTAEFLRMECNSFPSTSYIGNLESDDFDTIEILPDSENVTCVARYVSNGISRSREFSFSYSEEEKSGPGWVVYAAAGIMLLLIFWLVRKK